MAWDIFAFKFADEVKSLDEIPKDYVPEPIGIRSEIIGKILQVVPFANFSDPTWGTIEGPDFAIEVNIGSKEIVESFAFHVRGSNTAAGIVADILDHLGLRAFDTASENGFFDREKAVESLQKWREYRDKVVS